MTTFVPDVYVDEHPPAGIARWPYNSGLPQEWYASSQSKLQCELCYHLVDALWPLSNYPPVQVDLHHTPVEGDNGDIFVCLECAEAVRPRAIASIAPKEW